MTRNDEGSERDLTRPTERGLLLTGFVGASALTALVLVLSFPASFAKNGIGNLDILVLMLGTSCAMSVIAGAGLVVAMTAKEQKRDWHRLESLNALTFIFSMVVIIFAIPLLVLSISMADFWVMTAICLVLFTALLLSWPKHLKPTDSNQNPNQNQE